MGDREQVIADVQEAISILGKVDEPTFWLDFVINAMYDALALLKAQEPRVMTLAELEHAEVVYVEDKDKAEIIPVLVNGRHYDHFTMIKARSGGTMHVFRPSIFDYGKRWRCWTSRPDEKTREAIPWERLN